MTPQRVGAAVLAGVSLLALGLWSFSPGRVAGPARVEAAREYRVSTAGDGRVRWTLLDGQVPGGPVVLSDGVMQGDRGDPVAIQRAPGLVEGAPVTMGQALAQVQASVMAEDSAALAAELAALDAEETLLRGGGRQDAVLTAQRVVDVAQASLAQAQAQVAHLQSLVTQQVSAAWELEQAQQLAQVRRAELALARASLDEARRPPQDAELAELAARKSALVARLAAATERTSRSTLESPLAGIVALPGGQVVVAVRTATAPVLHIAVTEAKRARVEVGAPVRFSPTAEPTQAIPGRVLAVGGSAAQMGGETVVWVTAELDEDVPVGATGTAVVLDGGPS